MALPSLEMQIPGGLRLVAKAHADETFPSILITLRNQKGDEELLCFAEYNPEKNPNHEVCIGAYNSAHEDTAYYESYNT